MKKVIIQLAVLAAVLATGPLVQAADDIAVGDPGTKVTTTHPHHKHHHRTSHKKSNVRPQGSQGEGK